MSRGQINAIWILATTVVVCLVMLMVYKVGQHEAKKKVLLSELTQYVTGKRQYLIDGEFICQNGKDVGHLTVDLNLATESIIVVRNDSKFYPNCNK